MHKQPPSEARAKNAQCIKSEEAARAGRQKLKDKQEYTLFLSHQVENKMILLGHSNRFCYVC